MWWWTVVVMLGDLQSNSGVVEGVVVLGGYGVGGGSSPARRPYEETLVVEVMRVVGVMMQGVILRQLGWLGRLAHWHCKAMKRTCDVKHEKRY